MKRLLIAALILGAIPVLARDMESGRLVSADAEIHEIPADLQFGPSQTRVVNPSWFLTLFGGNCDALLSENDLAGSLTLKARAPGRIEFRFNNRPAIVLNQAESRYVPVHYRNSRPVHPSFQLKIPGWVSLHLEISKVAGKKTLRLFVIQGRPGNQRLLPVLEALEK